MRARLLVRSRSVDLDPSKQPTLGRLMGQSGSMDLAPSLPLSPVRLKLSTTSTLSVPSRRPMLAPPLASCLLSVRSKRTTPERLMDRSISPLTDRSKRTTPEVQQVRLGLPAPSHRPSPERLRVRSLFQPALHRPDRKSVV